jgi:hypothetical protein
MQRKIEQIYDALDARNYKLALTLSVKIKHPVGDAFRALCLSRLGQEEEAFKAIQLLKEQEPTDMLILQTMQMTLRNLNLFSQVPPLYANAFQRIPHEELGYYWFLSLVKIADYKGMQLVVLLTRLPQSWHGCSRESTRIGPSYQSICKSSQTTRFCFSCANACSRN